MFFTENTGNLTIRYYNYTQQYHPERTYFEWELFLQIQLSNNSVEKLKGKDQFLFNIQKNNDHYNYRDVLMEETFQISEESKIVDIPVKVRY